MNDDLAGPLGAARPRSLFLFPGKLFDESGVGGRLQTLLKRRQNFRQIVGEHGFAAVQERPRGCSGAAADGLFVFSLRNLLLNPLDRLSQDWPGGDKKK